MIIETTSTKELGSFTIYSADGSFGKDRVYWIDSTDRSISRSDLYGAQAEQVLADGLDSPQDIVFDSSVGALYWADSGKGQIYRANYDGSNVEEILTIPGITSIRSIAIKKDDNFADQTHTSADPLRCASWCLGGASSSVVGLVSHQPDGYR